MAFYKKSWRQCTHANDDTRLRLTGAKNPYALPKAKRALRNPTTFTVVHGFPQKYFI